MPYNWERPTEILAERGDKSKAQKIKWHRQDHPGNLAEMLRGSILSTPAQRLHIHLGYYQASLEMIWQSIISLENDQSLPFFILLREFYRNCPEEILQIQNGSSSQTQKVEQQLTSVPEPHSALRSGKSEQASKSSNILLLTKDEAAVKGESATAWRVRY